MDIRKPRLLVWGCLLTSLMSVVQAKDKEKEKPSREQPARAVTAPAAGRAESNANRGGNAAAKEAPRQRVESAPRIERRNDNNPPASNRSQPQVNSGNSSPKRDDTPRVNRGNNDRSPTKVIGGGQASDPRSTQNSRPEKVKVDSAPANQPNVRNERRDRNPPSNGNPPPGVVPGGNSSFGGLSQRDNDKNRTDRRDDSKPKPDAGKPGGNQIPKIGGVGNPGGTIPTGPSLGSTDGNKARDPRDDSKPKLDAGKPGTNQIPKVGGVGNPGGTLPTGPALGGTDRNKARDRRDDDKNRDGRDKNSLPKMELIRNEPGRPNLNPGGDAKTGVVRGNNNLPGSGKTTIIGKDDVRRRTTPIHIEKNGHAPKLDSRPEVLHLKPEVNDRIAALRQTRDHKEFERKLNELKALPDAKSHAELASLKLDRVSGVYQQRVERHDFRHLHESDVGRRLNLDRQFQLHRHGDLSRQMNLGPALVQAGGWQHRHHGHVIPTFTRSSFSVWYAGGGYYPHYCWTPRWTPWVDWCWWDTCLPIYDPRPVYCRPIVYTPCPTWVVYDYPAWQPLPVVTCGTWVDVPTVVVDSGTDLQLLATRFVDNGHPDQNLGPRYRVWLRNNGPLSTTTPFNVMLIAANDPVPQADLPQAGAIVNGIEAGQIQSVDIRLPLAANRLAVTPEGQRIPFSYLHVLVDSHRELVESNESNNGSVVARNDILPVDPAAFSSDVSAGAPGTVINVAGEGLGPEPGQVIVSINGLQLQAEIHGWYDLGVRFALPNIALAGATDADILIVRGDGAATNPLDFELVPQTMLGESPLPPIPSP